MLDVWEKAAGPLDTVLGIEPAKEIHLPILSVLRGGDVLVLGLVLFYSSIRPRHLRIAEIVSNSSVNRLVDM